MFASLLHPQLPFPVILAIAGSVFFIGSAVTGSICTFKYCCSTVKKVLAGVSLGMGIISATLGISATALTAMKAFGSQGSAALSAIGSEAAGSVEMTGAVSPGLAASAASEASSISGISSASSSIAVVP